MLLSKNIWGGNMKKRLIPLSLLLLTLSNCPAIRQENTKPKDIPKEKIALEINIKVNKNNYTERIGDYNNAYVINPLKSGLEEQLAYSENTLKDTLTNRVESIVKTYANPKDNGVYTIELKIDYPTGREAFMMDDFELGKE